MFSGIIEETGRVESLTPTQRSVKLEVMARAVTRGVCKGESVAVNGACLTVTERDGNALRFDVLRETLRRTNLRGLRVGDAVNLERALKLGHRIGGHFVTGHVDGVGRIKRFEKRGRDYFLEITAPAAVMKFIILKGSIAVDGISLTIAEVKQKSFAVWIIPHTCAATNLAARTVGARVNLEADLLGKYALKFLRAAKRSR